MTPQPKADSEAALLNDYVTEGSEQAFERLVSLHVDMVFGCAMRRTGDGELAKEISQTVFTILARKARRLKAGSGLAGWLHKTTLFESTKALRGESRRHRKMQALANHTKIQNDHASTTGAEEVLSVVDEALGELPDRDRHMIVLHFFEGRSFREIAATVGKSEAASQKQTSRALDKLAKILGRREVVATGTTLASILAAESAKSAPIGIAAAISGNAIAGTSSLTASVLISNTIQTMTYAKTKVAILVAVAAAVPISVQMQTIGELRNDLREYEHREAAIENRDQQLKALSEEIATLRTSDSLSRVPAAAMKQRPASSKGDDAAVAAATDDNAPLSLDEFMNDPGLRTVLERQLEAQIEVTHADLIAHLGLDENRARQLRSVLLKRLMAVDDEHAGAVTPTEPDYDGMIRELIGDENFSDFERFEDSVLERQELTAYRGALEAEGMDISFETEQALMAIMHQEQTSPESLAALPDLTALAAPGSMTQESSAALLEYYETVRQGISERVRSARILTDEQFEIFTKNQTSYLNLIRTGIDIAPLSSSENEKTGSE